MIKYDNSMIKDLILEINYTVSEYNMMIENAKIELDNLASEQKELVLEIEDMQQIIESYSENKEDTQSVFSVVDQTDVKSQLMELKAKELNIYISKYEIITERLDSKKFEYNELVRTKDSYADMLVKLQHIKNDVSNQIASINNEIYVKEVKDILQKKRLLEKENSKFKAVFGKMANTYLEPMKSNLEQMKQALNFIQTEPARAKQMLENIYQKLNTVSDEMIRYMDRTANPEPVANLYDRFSNYVSELQKLYPDVIIDAELEELQKIEVISDELNYSLMNLYIAVVNACVLNMHPKSVNLKAIYKDGYIIMNGMIDGEYINFYKEMKEDASSNSAVIYEKVFLLHGSMSCEKKEDGKVMLNIEVPVKNYL